MKYEIVGDTAFPLLKFYLDQGESIKADSGSMVAMTRDLSLTGKVDGGFTRAIARMFSGESFFMQNIEASAGPGWAILASPVPGEITPLEIKQGQEFIVTKSGFLAGTQGINVSSTAQGLTKGFLSGEGFFVVHLSGAGTAFLSTYGGMYPVDIPAGETLLVNNGHLVAWDAAMKYDITKGASSWISAATSGAGLACRFYGPGRILIQTRNPEQLGAWIAGYLPPPPARS